MGKPRLPDFIEIEMEKLDSGNDELSGDDELIDIPLTESDTSESEAEEPAIILLRPYPPFVGFMHTAPCLHRSMTFNAATTARLRSYNTPKTESTDISELRVCRQFCSIL